MNLTAGSDAAAFTALTASYIPNGVTVFPPLESMSRGLASVVCSLSVNVLMSTFRTASRGITGWLSPSEARAPTIANMKNSATIPKTRSPAIVARVIFTNSFMIVSVYFVRLYCFSIVIFDA